MTVQEWFQSLAGPTDSTCSATQIYQRFCLFRYSFVDATWRRYVGPSLTINSFSSAAHVQWLVVAYLEAPMLQVHGLSFSPDPRSGPLFDHLDLTLDQGEKVALLGRNGTGKSTLLKILSGRLTPTSGRFALASHAQVAYLSQDFDLGFEGTLLEFLSRDADDVPAHKIARAIHRMGLDNHHLDQSFSSLSLGERMRGAIGALLVGGANVLLLDEPTNHLDIPTKEWLEGFLRSCPETVLFACHDRMVTNAVAERILEMSQGKLTSYRGNFDAMSLLKGQTRAREQDAWEKHRDEDRRLRVTAEQALQKAGNVTKKPTQRTYDPKAKAFYAGKQSKMDKRAKSILQRVEKAREDAPTKPYIEDDPKLEFPCAKLRSSQALIARGLRKSFGQNVLFENLNLTLERGSRVAIVGQNGSGKTTLFRILLGFEDLDAGEVQWSPDVQVASLSQARDLLDYSLPAVSALNPVDAESERLTRSLLGRLGITGMMAERPIGVLSVGERTKVEIVSMILTRANVLVLDEPTNHLDLVSVEALEEALLDFPGAILFTSHDRDFVNRVSTEVIEIG